MNKKELLAKLNIFLYSVCSPKVPLENSFAENLPFNSLSISDNIFIVSIVLLISLVSFFSGLFKQLKNFTSFFVKIKVYDHYSKAFYVI